MNPQLTASRQFVSDLVQSGAVLLQRPALPILTLGLALATEVPSLWRSPHDWWAGLIFLAANVVMAGWVGTQRIWYLRAFRGGDIRPIELISLTGSFIPRFVILGVLITIPNAAVLPLLAWVVHNPRTLLTAWLVVPLVVSVTTDVLLTFVTPALAYSTRHVGEAFLAGLRLLRREWPHCAWYALVPPLALIIVTRLLPRSALSPAVSAIVRIAGFMVGLWLKGAIAAYYLRIHVVGDSGSA